jgi:hypothetical protein
VPLSVAATAGKSADQTLAIMSFPRSHGRSAPASDFHARVSWGDGSHTDGTAKRTSIPFLDALFPSTAIYLIRGTHRYQRTSPTRIEVSVAKRGTPTVTTRTRVMVERADPSAFFFSTPDVPHQAETAFHGLDIDSIADEVPATPGPLQRPIKQYRWEFGDGNTVVDDAKTRPAYRRLLAALANDPGNNLLKQQGIDLGILPGNAKSGPIALGGLSADEVRAIVHDWQVQFPAHVVPHVFPYSGTVGVRLTVTDSAGKTDVYVRNLAVSQECLQWGGNGLFGWNPFAGYTTCDTRRGFEAEIGPHRAPDYAVITLGSGFKLPAAARGLTAGGAAQLYITRGVLNGAPGSVLLGMRLSVGLGLASRSATVGFGWIGPPDPDHQPPDAAIAAFINGYTLPAGFSAGIDAGPVTLGGGLDFIYSPSQHQGGLEAYGGVTGVSASISPGACAAPLAVVGSGAADFFKRLYGTWNSAPPKPHPTIVGADLEQVARLLAGSVADIAQTVAQALIYCRP